MLCYELITVDATDPVYNPIWRQGCYGMPFISRIGVIGSNYSWSLGIKQSLNLSWTYNAKRYILLNAMLKGDGVVQNWLGHASFSMGTLSLAIRLMPAFFETFPVILIDQTSTVRADIAFRRGSSCYSMEQTRIILQILGGILNGTEYSTPSLVKDYARKAQFGSIFTFDRITSRWCDGVLRTSPRGWYSFSHTAFASCFFFGHLWHASRAVFQDIWTGVSIESFVVVEYGRNEKLGDKTTKASTFI